MKLMYKALIIVEKEDALIVAWAEDPGDWIARFERRPGFPALQWAERMVNLYNHGEDNYKSQGIISDGGKPDPVDKPSVKSPYNL